MSHVIDLVDSVEYTTTNCFAHQLHHALHRVDPTIQTVGLADIERYPRPERVICRLKQRTVCRSLDVLQRWSNGAPVVIFDQDPWENFRDGSPFKDTYARAAEALDVRAFAVTTRAWAQHVSSTGLPGVFVHMWVLPEYCETGAPYATRPIRRGFVGAIHPYRRQLFERLEGTGCKVEVQSGSHLPYVDYLRSLSDIGVFVHREESPVMVDGVQHDLRDGLWIKDVEAAARGCFTLRNDGADAASYYEGLRTVRLYSDLTEVPAILREIDAMDPEDRHVQVRQTVDLIRGLDRWHETAHTLLTL